MIGNTSAVFPVQQFNYHELIDSVSGYSVFQRDNDRDFL